MAFQDPWMYFNEPSLTKVSENSLKVIFADVQQASHLIKPKLLNYYLIVLGLEDVEIDCIFTQSLYKEQIITIPASCLYICFKRQILN